MIVKKINDHLVTISFVSIVIILGITINTTMEQYTWQEKLDNSIFELQQKEKTRFKQAQIPDWAQYVDKDTSGDTKKEIHKLQRQIGVIDGDSIALPRTSPQRKISEPDMFEYGSDNQTEKH